MQRALFTEGFSLSWQAMVRRILPSSPLSFFISDTVWSAVFTSSLRKRILFGGLFSRCWPANAFLSGVPHVIHQYVFSPIRRLGHDSLLTVGRILISSPLINRDYMPPARLWEHPLFFESFPAAFLGAAFHHRTVLAFVNLFLPTNYADASLFSISPLSSPFDFPRLSVDDELGRSHQPISLFFVPFAP